MNDRQKAKSYTAEFKESNAVKLAVESKRLRRKVPTLKEGRDILK